MKSASMPVNFIENVYNAFELNPVKWCGGGGWGGGNPL